MKFHKNNLNVYGKDEINFEKFRFLTRLVTAQRTFKMTLKITHKGNVILHDLITSIILLIK